MVKKGLPAVFSSIRSESAATSWGLQCSVSLRSMARWCRESPPSTPVLAYMRNPQNLSFYLGRSVEELGPGTVARRVCGRLVPVYYVFQDFALEEETVPCLDRPGVVLHRFRQYARGTMYVWWVPPQA